MIIVCQPYATICINMILQSCNGIRSGKSEALREIIHFPLLKIKNLFDHLLIPDGKKRCQLCDSTSAPGTSVMLDAAGVNTCGNICFLRYRYQGVFEIAGILHRGKMPDAHSRHGIQLFFHHFHRTSAAAAGIRAETGLYLL